MVWITTPRDRRHEGSFNRHCHRGNHVIDHFAKGIVQIQYSSLQAGGCVCSFLVPVTGMVSLQVGLGSCPGMTVTPIPSSIYTANYHQKERTPGNTHWCWLPSMDEGLPTKELKGIQRRRSWRFPPCLTFSSHVCGGPWGVMSGALPGL